MARLTSLASVLAALELPEDEVLAPRDGREGGPPVAGAPREGYVVGSMAHGAQPGYEIWVNARNQAQFYAAYAEMLEPGRRSRSRRRQRSRQRLSLGRRPGDGGDAWVGEIYPEGHWAGPATLATSYRLAAQYAALVDARWATKLAVRAAMAYVSSGLPFGLFLATGLLDDETLNDRVTLRALVEPFRNPEASDAIRHPVQQTYLLLAASSRPWLRDPLRHALRDAERRLTAHGLYSIGPQGIPLGDYVDLAVALRYDDDSAGLGGSGASFTEIARRLAGLQRIQATALRAAQRNRFMWRRGASAIDLENVALSGLALRHRPWFGELSEAISEQLVRDDELAELPLWTMGEVETELPDIADSVTDIMREPERAWRLGDFREPDTETDPWTGEAFRTRETTRSPTARSADEEHRSPASPTRPDYPVARRDDAAPGTRPKANPDTESYGPLGPTSIEYPQSAAYGSDDYASDGDEGDDGDDPYSGDK